MTKWKEADKEMLMNCLEIAEHMEAAIFAVEVYHEGTKGTEVITFGHRSIPEKRAYYQEAYDMDLRLNKCEDIRIVAFAYADKVADVYKWLGKWIEV